MYYFGYLALRFSCSAEYSVKSRQCPFSKLHGANQIRDESFMNMQNFLSNDLNLKVEAQGKQQHSD